MLDATTLSSESSDDSSAKGLTEAAEYLHDILLTLQKRHTTSKTSKGPSSIPVLIASNKLDLFTAIPTNLVKSKLENEISNLRSSRSKGLLDSGVGMDGDEGMEDREVLGGGGEGGFTFGLLEEYGVEVSVVGGNVLAAGGEGLGSDVGGWWGWIAERL